MYFRPAFRPEEGFNQFGRPTGRLRSGVGAIVQANVSYFRHGAAGLSRIRGGPRTAAGWKIDLDLHGQ